MRTRTAASTRSAIWWSKRGKYFGIAKDRPEPRGYGGRRICFVVSTRASFRRPASIAARNRSRTPADSSCSSTTRSSSCCTSRSCWPFSSSWCAASPSNFANRSRMPGVGSSNNCITALALSDPRVLSSSSICLANTMPVSPSEGATPAHHRNRDLAGERLLKVATEASRMAVGL